MAEAVEPVRVTLVAPRIIEALVTRDKAFFTGPVYRCESGDTSCAYSTKRGPKHYAREVSFDLFTVLFTRPESRGPHVQAPGGGLTHGSWRGLNL